MASADEITDQLVDPILKDLEFNNGQKTIVFVNGMGGTPLSELYIVYGRVVKRLKDLGVEVTRSLVGSYVTSLEMQGCSVTILRADDEMIELYDAPVNTVAYRKGM